MQPSKHTNLLGPKGRPSVIGWNEPYVASSHSGDKFSHVAPLELQTNFACKCLCGLCYCGCKCMKNYFPAQSCKARTKFGIIGCKRLLSFLYLYVKCIPILRKMVNEYYYATVNKWQYNARYSSQLRMKKYPRIISNKINLLYLLALSETLDILPLEFQDVGRELKCATHLLPKRTLPQMPTTTEHECYTASSPQKCA